MLSNPPTFWLVHSIFCSNSLEQSKNSQLIYIFRFNKLFWQIVKKKFYLNTRAKSERKWVTTILVHLCSWSSIQGLSTQIIFVNIFSCLMNEWMNEVQYWVQLPIKAPNWCMCAMSTNLKRQFLLKFEKLVIVCGKLYNVILVPVQDVM